MAGGSEPPAERAATYRCVGGREDQGGQRCRQGIRRGRIRLRLYLPPVVAEEPTTRPLPIRALAGSFWHQGPPNRALLDVADPAVTSGRYHRVGGAGVWYASSSETGAWAELFRHHEQGGVSPFEVRRLVGRVRARDPKVLDLTDEQVRAAFGVSDRDLTGDDLTRCQSIANRACAAAYDGILAPSAALKGQTTLVVFASAVKKISEVSSHVRHAPPRMSKFSDRVRIKRAPRE